MRRSRALLAVLATMLLLAGCSGGRADTGVRRAEDRLPDVTLRSLGPDRPLALREVEGPAVVNLWASWCGPCKKELPYYAQFAAKRSGTVKVIGIDYQETKVDAARALAKRSGVTYPLYADPDGRLRAIGLPKVMLVDARGRIVYQKYAEITSVAELDRLVRTHLGVGR